MVALTPGKETIYTFSDPAKASIPISMRVPLPYNFKNGRYIIAEMTGPGGIIGGGTGLVLSGSVTAPLYYQKTIGIGASLIEFDSLQDLGTYQNLVLNRRGTGKKLTAEESRQLSAIRTRSSAFSASLITKYTGPNNGDPTTAPKVTPTTFRTVSGSVSLGRYEYWEPYINAAGGSGATISGFKPSVTGGNRSSYARYDYTVNQRLLGEREDSRDSGATIGVRYVYRKNSPPNLAFSLDRFVELTNKRDKNAAEREELMDLYSEFGWAIKIDASVGEAPRRTTTSSASLPTTTTAAAPVTSSTTTDSETAVEVPETVAQELKAPAEVAYLLKLQNSKGRMEYFRNGDRGTFIVDNANIRSDLSIEIDPSTSFSRSTSNFYHIVLNDILIPGGDDYIEWKLEYLSQEYTFQPKILDFTNLTQYNNFQNYLEDWNSGSTSYLPGNPLIDNTGTPYTTSYILENIKNIFDSVTVREVEPVVLQVVSKVRNNPQFTINLKSDLETKSITSTYSGEDINIDILSETGLIEIVSLDIEDATPNITDNDYFYNIRVRPANSRSTGVLDKQGPSTDFNSLQEFIKLDNDPIFQQYNQTTRRLAITGNAYQSKELFQKSAGGSPISAFVRVNVRRPSVESFELSTIAAKLNPGDLDDVLADYSEELIQNRLLISYGNIKSVIDNNSTHNIKEDLITIGPVYDPNDAKYAVVRISYTDSTTETKADGTVAYSKAQKFILPGSSIDIPTYRKDGEASISLVYLTNETDYQTVKNGGSTISGEATFGSPFKFSYKWKEKSQDDLTAEEIIANIGMPKIQYPLSFQTPDKKGKIDSTSVRGRKAVVETIGTRARFVVDAGNTMTRLDAIRVDKNGLTIGYFNNRDTVESNLYTDRQTKFSLIPVRFISEAEKNAAITESSATGEVIDADITPSYTLSALSDRVDEGVDLEIVLTTTNLEDGTEVPYTITGVSSSDINNESLTGVFVINSNSASKIFTFSADETTEGTENFVISLDNDNASLTIKITDTSITAFGGPKLTPSKIETFDTTLIQGIPKLYSSTVTNIGESNLIYNSGTAGATIQGITTLGTSGTIGYIRSWPEDTVVAPGSSTTIYTLASYWGQKSLKTAYNRGTEVPISGRSYWTDTYADLGNFVTEFGYSVAKNTNLPIGNHTIQGVRIQNSDYTIPNRIIVEPGEQSLVFRNQEATSVTIDRSEGSIGYSATGHTTRLIRQRNETLPTQSFDVTCDTDIEVTWDVGDTIVLGIEGSERTASIPITITKTNPGYGEVFITVPTSRGNAVFWYGVYKSGGTPDLGITGIEGVY